MVGGGPGGFMVGLLTLSRATDTGTCERRCMNIACSLMMFIKSIKHRRRDERANAEQCIKYALRTNVSVNGPSRPSKKWKMRLLTFVCTVLHGNANHVGRRSGLELLIGA